MSDGPRSCGLTENIYLHFKNKIINFPSLPSVEEVIENLFISQCSQHEYSSDNFTSELVEQKIKITIYGESFIFEEYQEVCTLEEHLCSLYNKISNSINLTLNSH